MNLENLGVQEMDAKEVKQVDGGFIAVVIALAWGGLGAAIYGGLMAANFEKGYNDAQ